jgi:protocatechuate 3,4-dioxygenase beta subunit
VTPEPLSRRRALGLFAGAGITAVAAACSGGDSSSPATARRRPSTTAGSTEATGAGSGAAEVGCVLTPEATEGPYYLDLDEVRSDITEGRVGAPLDLRITVVDASTCAPLPEAAVDVWHCDADGIYSGFVDASTGANGPPPRGGGGSRVVQAGDGTTFLRGTQVTDADGVAGFATIYPGWYRGRAVHIHTKVHVGGSVVHTGQLFFADDLSDAVFASAPYAGKGDRDVRNADDSIYADAGRASAELVVSESGDGYVGEITVGVRTD